MGDVDRIRLLLREKYSLVHVPHYHKAVEWVKRTGAAVRRGVTPEEAGLTAMRELLPYEVKEHNVQLGTAVSELLELAEDSDLRGPDQ